MIRRIFEAEILVALRLSAFGQWWAASAARRLGKFSSNNSEDRP